MERQHLKRLFCFLKRIPDERKVVNDFWDIHQHKIKKWYKIQHEGEDLIISASPGSFY